MTMNQWQHISWRIGHNLVDVLFAVGFLPFLWFFLYPVDTSVHFPVTIITSVDTLSTSPAQAAAHNQVLSSVVAQQGATSNGTLAGIDNAKIQSRLFYSVIIATLLTIMFTDIPKYKGAITIVAFLVIMSLYMLDVSLCDLFNRQVARNDVLGAAQQKLVSAIPSDSTWHSLDYASLVSAATKASEGEARHYRKLTLALQPTLEQFIYYLLPFILVYVAGRVALNSSLTKRLHLTEGVLP